MYEQLQTKDLRSLVLRDIICATIAWVSIVTHTYLHTSHSMVVEEVKEFVSEFYYIDFFENLGKRL